MTRQIRRPSLLRRIGKAALALVLVAVLLSVGPTLLFRWLPPPLSSVMLQQRLAGEPVDYRWVPWPQIGPELALAVVAAEDQRFPEHRGFDLEAIRDAVADYRAGGRLRGASTISQQVSKNLFLWQGRSFLRKAAEVWFTVLLETLWPKRRILEVYLNIAEMGPGVYGVGAASQNYFGRSPQNLSPAQAALLAAVLPSPTRYDVSRPSVYLSERQSWILQQMNALGGPAYLQGLAGQK